MAGCSTPAAASHTAPSPTSTAALATAYLRMVAPPNAAHKSLLGGTGIISEDLTLFRSYLAAMEPLDQQLVAFANDVPVRTQADVDRLQKAVDQEVKDLRNIFLLAGDAGYSAAAVHLWETDPFCADCAGLHELESDPVRADLKLPSAVDAGSF
jgi:hypothetical protein